MVKTKQIATEATDDEIEQLLKATGEKSIKDALQNAMQYRIQNPKEA